MKPEVITRPGGYALVVPAGDVDSIAAGAGLEADGYFWEGVVRALVEKENPSLEKEFTFDSDDTACVAEARDRDCLDKVAGLLGDLVADRDRFARLVATSSPAEFQD